MKDNFEKAKINQLLKQLHHGGLTIKYWDGEEIDYGPEKSNAKITFVSLMPIGVNMLDPMMAFCEAYMDGIFEIDGSWEDLMRGYITEQ